ESTAKRLPSFDRTSTIEYDVSEASSFTRSDEDNLAVRIRGVDHERIVPQELTIGNNVDIVRVTRPVCNRATTPLRNPAAAAHVADEIERMIHILTTNDKLRIRPEGHKLPSSQLLGRLRGPHGLVRQGSSVNCSHDAPRDILPLLDK